MAKGNSLTAQQELRNNTTRDAKGRGEQRPNVRRQPKDVRPLARYGQRHALGLVDGPSIVLLRCPLKPRAPQFRVDDLAVGARFLALGHPRDRGLELSRPLPMPATLRIEGPVCGDQPDPFTAVWGRARSSEPPRAPAALSVSRMHIRRGASVSLHVSHDPPMAPSTIRTLRRLALYVPPPSPGVHLVRHSSTSDDYIPSCRGRALPAPRAGTHAPVQPRRCCRAVVSLMPIW